MPAREGPIVGRARAVLFGLGGKPCGIAEKALAASTVMLYMPGAAFSRRRPGCEWRGARGDHLRHRPCTSLVSDSRPRLWEAVELVLGVANQEEPN